MALSRLDLSKLDLSRIDGHDELYVGGALAFCQPNGILNLEFTHVLSLVAFDLASLKRPAGERRNGDTHEPYRHSVIDVDDMEDTDLVAELPRAIRFIHGGLANDGRERQGAVDEQRQKEAKERPVEGEKTEADEPKERGDCRGQALHGSMQTMQVSNRKRGRVLVHCAAGKSRSVAVVVAYLLWRYPRRFDPDLGLGDDDDGDGGGGGPATSSGADGASPSSSSRRPLSPAVYASAPASQPLANDKTSWRQQQQGRPLTGRKRQPRPRKETAREAIEAALALVHRTRPKAEPNQGFMRQLALWWEMGCPVDDVRAQPAYQLWAYRRQVEAAVAAGQAPSRLRFEDEEQQRDGGPCPPGSSPGQKLRCKRCRYTLATAAFILAHGPPPPPSSSSAARGETNSSCPHYFVEPLAWMRAELEKGQLGGRLVCPNGRCGAGVGRYDWKGIRCACGAWVAPGLSLKRARVDEQLHEPRTAAEERRHGPTPDAERLRLGIRLPPGWAGRT